MDSRSSSYGPESGCDAVEPERYPAGSAAETERVGERIGAGLVRGDVVALFGGLGAGKTTLTKGIARALGISEPIVSPTYTYVHEYDGSPPFFHVDLYRIAGEADFESIGGDDLLDNHGVTVIEWSERIADVLPQTVISVTIEATGPTSRMITVVRPPGRSKPAVSGNTT